MKITVYICVLLMLASTTGYAQNNDKEVSGIALSLGAAATYYYGPGDRNFGKYESDRVNYQVNSMLGLALTHDKKGRRTLVAAFGSLGFNNERTMQHILEDESYLSTSPTQRNSNNFYTLEGGLLIAEIFRISTGVGQQNFDEQTLVNSDGHVMFNKKSLQYNSTTVGFHLNFTAVALSINCNVATGKDFKKSILTPAAGLMIRL